MENMDTEQRTDLISSVKVTFPLKSMTMYCLELMRRAISKGDIFSATLILLKNIRSRLFGQYSQIFEMVISDSKGWKSSIEIKDYKIKEISSWDMVDDTLRQTFTEHEKDIWWDTESMLNKGSRLWIGYLRDKAACILWTTAGDNMDSYFFPLTSHCTVISHCVTLKQYRGCGLYPATLGYIVCQLFSQGITRFYIHCADWNLSSIRSISKAGFGLLGHGIAKKNGQLVWRRKPQADFVEGQVLNTSKANS